VARFRDSDTRVAAPLPYRDRRAAGRELAGRLGRYAGRDDLLVLGLPRGGVPVAAEIAEALGAPLDVFVVRKLGVPGQEELAFGAVASGGARALNDLIVRTHGIAPPAVDDATGRAMAELRRQEAAYRAGRAGEHVSPAGRTVIVVDDGLATGATMRAALVALRSLRPAAVVAASPVAPPGAGDRLRDLADEVVCGANPSPFEAVGRWYEDFQPVEMDEVRRLLGATRPGDGGPESHQEVNDMARTVREVMTAKPVALQAGTTLQESARAMRDHDVGAVIVLEDDRVRGIVTDRDITVRAVAEGREPQATVLAEISSDRVVTVSPDDAVDRAVALMREHAIRRLPVVESGMPVGIVSLGDLAVERDPGSALGAISAAEPNR
jgi:predicted phosphoribosyltransferase/predicted transcriptional regulator